MHFTILTLFPEVFDSALSVSLFGKAVEKGLIDITRVNFREFARDRHRVVDDAPYGGGAGMVIKVEPVTRALDDVKSRDPHVHTILLSPQGRLLDQKNVNRLSGYSHLALLCGRYEGMDERITSLVDEELSVGDYILSGGETAAWVVMDAVSRLVPGVLGRSSSYEDESFSLGILEYPQYTRPRRFRDMEVPDILISGDHGAIADWRRRQALLRTMKKRPDLVSQAAITDEERAWLKEQTCIQEDNIG